MTQSQKNVLIGVVVICFIVFGITAWFVIGAIQPSQPSGALTNTGADTSYEPEYPTTRIVSAGPAKGRTINGPNVNNLFEAIVEYDRFDDSTTVTLECPKLPVMLNSKVEAEVQFLASFNGTEPTGEVIYSGMILAVDDGGFGWGDNRQLIVDGERINLPDFAAKEYTAMFVIDVPTMIKMCNAQQVDFRAGVMEGSLTAEHRSGIYDLLCHVLPMK